MKTRIHRFLKQADEFLFTPATPGIIRRSTLVFVAALYVLGLWHWLWFFNYGEMSYKVFDWKEKYRALYVFKLAWDSGSIPYHFAPVIHMTNRFFALPHVIISPQVLFLGHMTMPHFLLLQIALFYTIGFIGGALLCRTYRLSPFVFLLFSLLFGFNGYITSHLAVGHTEWYAYFILPYVAYLTLALARGEDSLRHALWLAFVFFCLFMQGAFHMVVWSLLFLGIMLITHWRNRLFRDLVVVCAAAIMLSAFRIMPVLTTFSDEKLPFVSGYSSLGNFAAAFALIRDFHYPLTGGGYGIKGGWWEYDMYTSVVGLAFLVCFGVLLRFARKGGFYDLRHREFDWPIVCFVLLCYSCAYYPIYISGIPLLSGMERAPSRFVVIPFLFLLVLACLRLQCLFDSGRVGVIGKMAGVLGAGYMAGMLFWHSRVWAIARLAPYFQDKKIDLSVRLLSVSDPGYVRVVKIGFLVSVVSLVVWGAALWLTYRGRPAVLAPSEPG